MAQFVNIAAYKFVDLDGLAERKHELLPLCRSLDLKGTILLSQEGINLFVAGSRGAIDQFLLQLRVKPEFEDLEVKESLSDHQPFSRMLVRLKKEIISMGVEAIRPKEKTSPKLPAKQLKQWLDEGKPITLYDVRNDYEVEVGTFENAIPAGIDHFRKFPEATRQLPESLKKKPLVMFCTGGIRCEKAGPLMEEQGFEEVYQLEGGILKYFEECGGDYWKGNCFVFDKRVAVDPQLQETDFEQCFACQAVLTVEQQASPLYQPPHQCPECYQSEAERMQERLEERNNLMGLVSTPLPGAEPYENIRPMNVPLRFDHQSVIDFLCGMHVHLSGEYWKSECELGRILYQDKVLGVDDEVRAGWRVEHVIPQTTEPPVNGQIEFIYEDEALVGLNKPAPLPMHPCGRFNRNSLNYLVGKVYAGEQLRILHRLDSNTTGVLLLARNKAVARKVHRQFVQGQVGKEYLALVKGHPESDQFKCSAPIGDSASIAGSRDIDPEGLPSVTDFEVVERRLDGTALIRCQPVTGRTNQIRLHLSHLGFPIVGDPTYRTDGKKNQTQTLSPSDPPMCLHASRLELMHPLTDDPFVLEASSPDWARSQPSEST